MAPQALVDHSAPPSSSVAAPIASASNLVLIDNYDSFTWNVYQFLVIEGATVNVFRNDEITLDQLISKKPTQLVISPGPGHPVGDAGISNDAIRHFSGKIPILGVCLGEQCIYHVFGGKVDVTGEILHGKTSSLQHDSKGVYAGLPQGIPVTRYHSLAGTHPTLPDTLEVSSWVESMSDSERGTIIMGVRHRKLLVEGVQFHPESILTAHGKAMLRNFLRMQGGTWEENERMQEQLQSSLKATSRDISAASPNKPLTNGDKHTSILDTIYNHRRAAVQSQMLTPSFRLGDLQAALDLGLAPPQISFPGRLRQSPYRLSLMAEIKRASPSKGIISLSTCAPAQARLYALAGASVISVLTEPEWFKGSINDLQFVRRSLESMPNRPAILRKEFIFNEYQILEARLAGADSVLLIVKMLDQVTLKRLYLYSQSLGMEPLVEVNTIKEMEIAIKLGSQVIGVNNRNLTNFEVDLETTNRLMSQVPKETIVCALSGIAGRKDVDSYLTTGVGAVLIGEALMRAADTQKFIVDLLGNENQPPVDSAKRNGFLVKVCGTRTPEAAKAAIDAGADLIGMILVKGRRRCVTEEAGLAVSHVVHNTPKPRSVVSDDVSNAARSVRTTTAEEYFSHTRSQLLCHPSRALLVGVFLDQDLDYILEQQRLLQLDIVQLHGSEPLEWARLLPVPTIKVFKPGVFNINVRGYHAAALLDSGTGGSGQRLELSDVKETLRKDSQLTLAFAGGLTPENVGEVVSQLRQESDQVFCLDVSSGVEVDGEQSITKIQNFVAAAKSA